jgi:SLT domain-containing protein
MTDYALAEAFVQIRPDTTGFQAETEAKIKAALAGLHPEVTVKVVPDVAGFQALLKAALAKALGSTGKATIPVKVAFDVDEDSLARQLALLKSKMAQTGLVDFLDYDLPIGKIQYQIALLRRLLQQGKLTDFLGVSLNEGDTLQAGVALRQALQRELGNVDLAIGLSPEDIAAEAAAIKAAAKTALGGETIPITEVVTGAGLGDSTAGVEDLTAAEDALAAATVDADAKNVVFQNGLQRMQYLMLGGSKSAEALALINDNVAASADAAAAAIGREATAADALSALGGAGGGGGGGEPPPVPAPAPMPEPGGGGGGGLAGQAAAANADAAALLRLAAASTDAGDAAKFAYAANIASNIGLRDTETLIAPVSEAMNVWAGRWGVLTNKLSLFGGALNGLPLVANVALWHVLTDWVIEFAAVLIPATVAFIAFGAAAAPTAQHIFVQMSNLWTTTQALGQGIYPITNKMMALGNAVKPEVYVLFGEALAVVNAKAGEFSSIAAAAGHQLDILGARAAAALVTGGLGTFMAKGPQDLAKLGAIVGDIFGIVGNLLKTMPGYAQDLLNVFGALFASLEHITGSPITQWVIKLGLAMHGAILYGGLAITAFVLVGNALGALAARFGIADAAALSFDASLFQMGVIGMLTGVKELGVAVVTLAGGEDIAAASSDILAGAFAALDAVNPVVWVVAAAAAIGAIVYALTRATSATRGYDAAVQAALTTVPFNQLGVTLAEQYANTLSDLDLAQQKLNTTQKTSDQVQENGAVTREAMTAQYRNIAGQVAGYRGELGTLQGYQSNYNDLLKAAGGNLAMVSAAGITNNQILGASKSQMAENIILVQAQVDQFKAMALGTGRAGAAMNALNYSGDTTNNMLGSLDVDMAKVTQGQDALIGVILGGEQAFVGFQQAIIQWGTDLGKSAGYMQALTGETSKGLTQQSDFYNTVVPAAQKLVDALEMQLAPTKTITTATADEAKEMLALGGNTTASATIVESFINDALGPGTVNLKDMNTWTKNNSTSQQAFQQAIATSTVNAGILGGTISTLTQDLFNNDLMLSSHVTPDMKAYSNAIVNNGLDSDQARAARLTLIKDYENIGLSAQAATALVNGLTRGLINVPGSKTTTLHLQGVGEISLRGSGAYIQGESGHIQAYAAGTKGGGAAKGWGIVGEKGPELVKFGGGEAVLPMYAGGTPGADMTWLEDTSSGMQGAFASGAAAAFAQGIAKAMSAIGTAGGPLGPAPGIGGNVVGWIEAAMRMAGAPASWLVPLERLVSLESGGNPRAVDPILVDGENATGLFQMLPSTYAAYATVAGGVYNPIAEGVAAIRYIRSRYGDPMNIPGLMSGHYGGYDQGGWLMPGATMAFNGTGKPEMVTTSDKLDDLITEVKRNTNMVCSAIGTLTGVTAGSPAKLASSLNGVASQAVTRVMYPNRAGASR